MHTKTSFAIHTIPYQPYHWWGVLPCQGGSLEPLFQTPTFFILVMGTPDGLSGEVGEVGGSLKCPNIHGLESSSRCTDHFEVCIMEGNFFPKYLRTGCFMAQVVTIHHCFPFGFLKWPVPKALFPDPPPNDSSLGLQPLLLLLLLVW